MLIKIKKKQISCFPILSYFWYVIFEWTFALYKMHKKAFVLCLWKMSLDCLDYKASLKVWTTIAANEFMAFSEAFCMS